MSYNLKYWNEFINYFDETIRIEILGRDFSGSSTEIKTLATPLVISYPGDDNNLFNPIIGSQATINLLSESNFQFIDLHNSDARAHRVDIYKESVLDWTGWILPDLFSEPYIAPPYPVSITARCGLGELKEVEIPDSFSNLTHGSVVLGNVSNPDLYSIIATYLLSIETSVILNESVNVYADTNDTTSDSPIANTTINISAYEGKTAYEAISDILVTFGARLYQQNGEWWIVRAKEMTETLTVRQWTMTLTGTNFFSLDTTQLKTFLVSRPSGNQIVNESPQLDINPAWKKFTWIQDLGKYESFILNHKFTDWVQYYVTERNQSWRVELWDEISLGFLRRFTLQDGSYFAQFGDIGVSNWVKQSVNVKASVNQSVNFKIVFDALSNSTLLTETSFRFIVKITGASTYYLNINGSDEFEWTTTSSNILVENFVPSYTGGTYAQRGATADNWKTYEFLVDGFPIDGTMEIKIFGCGLSILELKSHNANLRLKEVSAILLTDESEPYQEEQPTEIAINENNIYTPDDIETVGGDLPDKTNEVIIWENGYRFNDNSATKLWHERGSAEEYQLLQLIGKDYSNIFQLPQFKLTIPILSRTINFDSCIIDYLILPKKYICTSAEIDYQTCIFRGTFMEFSSWEDSPWILEDGTWNDDGIWVDDDVWKDDDTNLITINITSEFDNDITSYFSINDVIETLPINVPGIGGILKEDDVTITIAPHTFTGTLLEFRKNPFVVTGTECTFNATISGVLKTVKIILTL